MKLLIATGLAVILTLPATANAAEAGPGGKTYWHAETTGSPVATEIGRWTEIDERTVRLEFTGGHLVGAGTTFEARWLSPYTTEGKRARFDSEWELENYNHLGDDIKIRSMFRFRERGGSWYPWITIDQIFKPGSNFMGAGAGFRSGDRDQVQFEWRLEGEIVAPTYLAGSAELSIN